MREKSHVEYVQYSLYHVYENPNMENKKQNSMWLASVLKSGLFIKNLLT